MSGSARRGAGGRTLDLLLGLVLAAGILWAYRDVGSFDFVSYDDDVYVTANPHLTGGLTAEALGWALGAGYAGNWHPLTWGSHLVDVELFGVGNAGAMHRVNLAWHVLNAALLFVGLRLGTGRRWAAFLAAALFAWHPLRVESVAWISERKDLLCGTFTLAALLAHGAWVRRGARGLPLLTTALMALGAMAKPMIVSLPLLLLLVDRWPLARREPLGARVREKLPLFAIALASAAVTWWVQARGGAVSAIDQMGPALRLLNAFASLGVYLRQFLWPADLACFYPLAQATTLEPLRVLLPGALLGALASVGLLVAGWRLRARAPFVLVGWAGALVAFLPVIGIVQVGRQAHADRYTYLPLIGVAVIAAYGLDALAAQRARLRPVLTTGAGAALAALLVATARQSRVWRDDPSLYGHAIAVTEKNPLAHGNLGVYLRERGDRAGARESFRRALADGPREPGLVLNLAIECTKTGRFAEARALLEELLEATPEDWRVHSNLGELLFRTGDLEGARRAYEASFRLGSPYVADRLQLALVLVRLGERAEARASLSEADAIEDAERQPAYLVQLGLLWEAAGDRRRALATLAEARARGATDPRVPERRAWILATAPEDDLRDPAAALAMARALPGVPEGRAAVRAELLAAALAATGAFEEAARVQEQALGRLAPEARALGLRRLEAYRSGRPWREEP